MYNFEQDAEEGHNQFGNVQIGKQMDDFMHHKLAEQVHVSGTDTTLNNETVENLKAPGGIN